MFETIQKQWHPKNGEGESEDDDLIDRTEMLLAKTKKKEQEKKYNTRLLDHQFFDNFDQISILQKEI